MDTNEKIILFMSGETEDILFMSCETTVLIANNKILLTKHEGWEFNNYLVARMSRLVNTINKWLEPLELLLTAETKNYWETQQKFSVKYLVIIY